MTAILRFCAASSFADTLRVAIRPHRPKDSGGIAPIMAMASADSTNQLMVESAPGSKSALPMVITLFFLWGFITVFNPVLIPHLKSLFT